jgi:hypothetical protein
LIKHTIVARNIMVMRIFVKLGAGTKRAPAATRKIKTPAACPENAWRMGEAFSKMAGTFSEIAGTFSRVSAM